jgi:hypothetical protein
MGIGLSTDIDRVYRLWYTCQGPAVQATSRLTFELTGARRQVARAAICYTPPSRKLA